MPKNNDSGKPAYVQYGLDRLEFTIFRSSRKSIGICVNSENVVKVTAPKWVSEGKIKGVVFEKAPWILKKLAQIKIPKEENIKYNFTDGEVFKYLGDEYILELDYNSQEKLYEVFLKGNKITLQVPRALQMEHQEVIAREKITMFFKNSAERILKERIAFYSSLMKVSPQRIVIKQQKTRWGSCSSKGNVNINWKIIMAPLSVIDYLVVHELAHLKFMNHSKMFWDFVEATLPDFKARRKWLKLNQNKLYF
jgi:predicted metal-dependent hydrolase